MKISKVLISFIIMISFSLSCFAGSVDVTAVEDGFSDVLFSDGYRGFCIDANLKGAGVGDTFTPSHTTIATNNNTGAEISQYLKILFTQHFNEIFVSDGNGGYVLDDLKADSTIQSVIWNLSDDRYIWGESKTIVNSIKAYTGEEIPDEGYILELDNGDKVTFYFVVMQTHKDNQQNFFAYKIVVNEKPAHSHTFDKQASDENNHWKECECGEKDGVEPHSGGIANCINPPICDDCGVPYGKPDPDNHTGNTVVKNYLEPTDDKEGYTGDTYCSDCSELIESGEEIPKTHSHSFNKQESDDTNHWKECECGEKDGIEPHNFEDGKCIICEKIDENYKPDDDDEGNNSGDNASDDNTDNDGSSDDVNDDGNSSDDSIDDDLSDKVDTSDKESTSNNTKKDKDTKVPKTGVDFNTSAAIGVMVFSMCGLVVVFYINKKYLIYS